MKLRQEELLIKLYDDYLKDGSKYKQYVNFNDSEELYNDLIFLDEMKYIKFEYEEVVKILNITELGISKAKELKLFHEING